MVTDTLAFIVVVLLCFVAPIIHFARKLLRKKQEEADIKKAHEQWVNLEEPANRNAKGYPPDWKLRRFEVYERDKGKCRECGNETGRIQGLFPGASIKVLVECHIHHVKPVSKGGNHALDNLVLLCEECHIEKHPDKEKEIRARRKRTEIRRKLRRLWLKDADVKSARHLWQCDACKKEIRKKEKYYGGRYNRICKSCCEVVRKPPSFYD